MDLKEKLQKLNIIEHAEFDLRGGDKTKIYFDVKKAFGNTALINFIATELYKLFDKSVTCIAASGYGGIPIAVVISDRYNLPLVLVRQKDKDHGIKKRIEGYIPNKNDNVAVVDDVFTKGTSLISTIEVLKEFTNIEGCYVVIKRTDNNFRYKLVSLFQHKEFI